MVIGEVGFDWQPTELEEAASGLRGQDDRLTRPTRVRADERRYAKDLRRAERLGLGPALDADVPEARPLQVVHDLDEHGGAEGAGATCPTRPSCPR